MFTSEFALTALVAYLLCFQWAFRGQRVDRNLIILCINSADHRIVGLIMPTEFVSVIWIGRGCWLFGAWAAWQAWQGYGIGISLITWIASMFIDGLSP